MGFAVDGATGLQRILLANVLPYSRQSAVSVDGNFSTHHLVGDNDDGVVEFVIATYFLA